MYPILLDVPDPWPRGHSRLPQVIGALLFGGDVLAASSAEGAQLYVDPGQAALAEFALGYVRAAVRIL